MDTLEKSFVSVAGLLLSVGLLMVYSASLTSRPCDVEQVYFSRQALFLGVSVLAACGAALAPSHWWRPAAPALFALTLVLLGAVLIPGLGLSVNGSQRWLRFGSISLQPSELAKITLPLLLCRVAADGRWRRDGMRLSLLVAIVPLALTLALVLCEPDLGTAVFLALTSAVALFLCGWPMRRFLGAAAAAMPLLGAMVAFRPYQLARINGFLAAWKDFDLAPYQVRQSLTSLGAGGLLGTGLGHGQQKLSFLPEANTDFVFAVIGEELGLGGTLGVVLLLAALYALGVRLLSRLPRGSFEHAAGLTLLTGLVLQAAINMAVVLALVPPKGISLPLISYGGSNLLVSLCALGIVLGLTRARPLQYLTPDPCPLTPDS